MARWIFGGRNQLTVMIVSSVPGIAGNDSRHITENFHFVHLFIQLLCWMNWWMDYCTDNFHPSNHPPALLDELMDEPLAGLLYKNILSIYSSTASVG